MCTLSGKNRAVFCKSLILNLSHEQASCIIKMYMPRATKKSKQVGTVKPKAKVLQQFTIEAVQKFYD